MADSEFERFKKMYPGGLKDMPILAVPAPLPGPGGIGRAVVGRAVQSGIRRFSDVGKADKVTKMKGRDGLARKPQVKKPDEPKVVESGRSEALRKVREGGGGLTKMKDRRGLEIKTQRKAETPPSRANAPRGMGVVTKGYVGVAESKSKPLSNAEVQRSYQELNRKHGTQRPVTEVQRAIPIPRAKPDRPKKDVRPAAKKAAKRSAPKAKPSIRFSGNWKNAAPTQMQKRMGQRIKRPNLMNYLKGK